MNNREENIILNDEKRFAGDFEIINSLIIGDKEVVLVENQTATDNEKYMCAYCTSNDLIARYDEVMASDNYAEIVELLWHKGFTTSYKRGK